MNRETIDREHVGCLMHKSWLRTKRAQRFHGPNEACISPTDWVKAQCEEPVQGEVRRCVHFHPDLIPWEDLPEKQKDINRHAFDDVLPYFERLLADERERYAKLCEKCKHPMGVHDNDEATDTHGCWICAERARGRLEEREKVREMCVGEVVKTWCKFRDAKRKPMVRDLLSNLEQLIEQLDLTKDLAPSKETRLAEMFCNQCQGYVRVLVAPDHLEAHPEHTMQLRWYLLVDEGGEE
ncbi:hypothetical protein LCGC14_1239270 [marine sediment metagenome]|uniref:Uncharacterized protein n=1 Tax=marine sediment metagenome TaxID=412755 RepID=A0A0F9LTG9_9ZZZZ